MITLYHGSPYRVEHPLVAVGRVDLDFGQGFYLTRLRSQAESWAQIISSRQQQPAQAWLNTYVFDLDTALKEGYRMIRFENYDRDWLEFIAASRTGRQPWQKYDIIEGGVANDRIFRTIENYLNELASLDFTLGKLAYTKPNHQLCLRSQPLINQHLHHVGSNLIDKKGGTPC